MASFLRKLAFRLYTKSPYEVHAAGLETRLNGKKRQVEKIEAPLGKFKKATDVLEAAGIDHLVFGGIAVWAYGRRRWTRDIDLFIYPDDAKAALLALDRGGFATEETDHKWIYKASLDGASIDLIFRAKGEVVLTTKLLERRRRVKIDGHAFTIMDPENLVLVKILATKEIRPADWYDAISILTNLQKSFDWPYFGEIAGVHVEEVLSFLFFARAFGADGRGADIVPLATIHRLVDIYIKGQSSSKRRYA